MVENFVLGKPDFLLFCCAKMQECRFSFLSLWKRNEYGMYKEQTDYP